MFKNADKSFYLIRKIVNVVYFILMIASIITGIILIATSQQMYKGSMYVDSGKIVAGIIYILLGPVIFQFCWLVSDVVFNCILDLKNIRNASYGLPAEKGLPAPLFMGKLRKNEKEDQDVNVYEKLKKYKSLLDENIITKEEFDEIKEKLMVKKGNSACASQDEVSKVRELKSYLDENIITEEEFDEEKRKILKK